MRSIIRDVRFAIRVLGSTPGYTAVAVLALALGIGATTSIFTYVDSVFLRPFPYPALDRMVAISVTDKKQGSERRAMSLADYQDVRAESRTLQQVSACTWWDANLTGTGDPEKLGGIRVTRDFFSMIGAPPQLGRFFTPEEADGRQGNAVVISNLLWQTRFASNPNVAGTSLVLNGVTHTIVGVLREDYDFPLGADLWTPLVETPAERASRGARNLSVYGRLAPGATVSQAHAEVEQIGARLANAYPDSNSAVTINVENFREALTFGSRQFVLVIWAAALFVLLLACVNVANLQLGRGMARRREIAVRAALGASRLRIVRQFLTESVVLSVAGSAAGLALAAWGRVMWKNVPAEVVRYIPGYRHVGINTTVLAVTVLTAVAAALIFGIGPALQQASAKAGETLKQANRGSSTSRHPFSAALIMAQVALALLLLTGAGLMVKTFNHLMQVKRGYEEHNVLTARVALPEGRYATPDAVRNFYRDVLERLHNSGGVSNATAATMLPASGDTSSTNFVIEGRAAARGDEMHSEVRVVSDGYFSALRIPIVDGRAIELRDSADAQRVAVVSRTFVRRYFTNQNPIGQRLRLAAANQEWLRIVGVAGDVSQDWFREFTDPVIYVPLAQRPVPSVALMVRTHGDPNRAGGTLRAAVRAVDAQQPVYQVISLEAANELRSSGIRGASRMMSVLAMIGLVLAATGIYAVIAYSVAERTHEIGIRMALGAQRYSVLALVAGKTARLMAAGLVLGFAGSVGAAYGMTQLMVGVIALNVQWWLLLALMILMASVGLLAGYIPARRATRIDPLEALRVE